MGEGKARGSKSKGTALETPERARKGSHRFGARTYETETQLGARTVHI